MELLIGLFGGMATFCFVAIFGLAYVDGGRMFLRRDRGKSAGESRQQVASGPAFAPLDLGEAPMKWPSETTHPRRPLPELKWPSETWTDDFFGRKSGSFAHAAAPVVAEPAAQGRVAPAEEAFFGATPEPAKKPAKARQEKKPAPKQPAKPPTAKPPPSRAAAGGLSEDEIIAIVEREGLAAAVEKVRGTTGADFQTAATQIAAILRKRRGRG